MTPDTTYRLTLPAPYALTLGGFTTPFEAMEQAIREAEAGNIPAGAIVEVAEVTYRRATRGRRGGYRTGTTRRFTVEPSRVAGDTYALILTA